MYSVYILKSYKDGFYYVGQTNNLLLRLSRHNMGYVKSTKSKAPYKIIHSETFLTRSKAMKREKEIKSYKGGEAFKKLICVGGRVVNYNRL